VRDWQRGAKSIGRRAALRGLGALAAAALWPSGGLALAQRRPTAPPVAPGPPVDDGGDESGGQSMASAPAGKPKRYPVPDDQPPDYDIPNGHFFSQPVPGAPRGFGFSVANAAGVPFWKEFERLGGLQALGYPLSQRFAAGPVISQAFQQAMLRWRPETGRAEPGPYERSDVPTAALDPEPPCRLAAWAAHQPWSGWWWPATLAVGGPHLFDYSGPLAKYDKLVAASGRDDPHTLEWERDALLLDGLSWAGHCNGWSAAALLEDEPIAPVSVGGVDFSVADQKGLLTAYHFADAAAWLHGDDETPLSPADFHRRLVEWLGNGHKGFIFTFRPSGDDEVWSFPTIAFDLVMGPDPGDPNVTHVRANVWLADNDVPADFVGLRPWRGDGRTYEYVLYGPREAPTGGDWEGDNVGGGFGHPYYIWYPDPDHRNLDRQLCSPDLDYKVIKRILKGRA
jgi:hypothetical protein